MSFAAWGEPPTERKEQNAPKIIPPTSSEQAPPKEHLRTTPEQNPPKDNMPELTKHQFEADERP